jgi:O-antigen ligase
MWMPARWALSGFQLAVLAYAAVRVRTLRLHPASLTLAAIVLWGGAQCLAGWTVDAFRTQELMLDWTVNFAAFALALELSADPNRRERFLTGALLFATALSVLAMLTAPRGFFGPFVYRNQYAAFVEALLPLALLRAFLDRERAWAYSLAAGLLFAGVVASGSRTGVILCVLEVLAVPLLIRGRAAWRVALGIAASVGTLTLVAGWQPLWSRFQEPHPYSLRWDLLQSSLEMWRARPWTGWGLGTWSQVYPGFARYDDGTFVNQAHNDWAQWAAEGGLPVFAAMLFVLGSAVRPALRSVWGVGVLAVLTHCFFDYPMQQRPALAAFFFALLGIVMGVRAPQAQPEISPHKPLGHT